MEHIQIEEITIEEEEPLKHSLSSSSSLSDDEYFGCVVVNLAELGKDETMVC
jgi:hypothetical protein